eukprot:TRINITY_DN7735_c0_g1_i3.p1 TRINITY_DN7735_c0_g1~~TRINITY_DN7735_c0_g1_i3.p1  ORF type:complete len:116 (+),score=21.66 TRINITY_DN7735_c0_g1_i3:25-348(+)
MPPKIQKSKEAKALAAMSASKGKGKKKKWSKVKVRETKNHAVVFDQALYDRLIKDVPKKMRVITVYTLCEQYKINGSLARRAINILASKGQIRPVSTHSRGLIYTKK